MLLFGLAGVGLILCFELGGENPRAVGYGLLSGVCYGGVVLSLRQLRDHDATWLIALNHLAAALAFLPFVAVQPQYWPRGSQWLYLAAFGIFQMGVPYILFARGLKTTPSHEASAIALLEPLLVPCWVFLAWHDSPSYTAPRWWTLAGGGLILLGLVWRYAGERGEKGA
jgi:drug/metabolite transporter (DMT)-like permease